MAEQQEQNAVLLKKRGVLKGQLTRFETFLNNIQNQPDRVQISERLTRIEKLFDSFDSVQTEIEICDDSEDEKSERDLFENKLFALICRAKRLLNPSIDQQFSPVPSNLSSHNSNHNDDYLNVKLPPIELPIFSGQNYSDWLPFFETFQALVHNHSKLSKIQKFYYLQSSLKQDAKDIISSLEVTEDNYEVALNLLRERYDNQRLIINNHVKNIFNLPPIKESHHSLRKLIDSIQRDLKALITLNEPVDQWDTLLIYLISSKLDIVTRREWEIYSLRENTTQFESFMKFLKDKCQILETMQSNKLESKTQFQTHSNEKPKYNKIHSLLALPKTCSFCNLNHKFFQCSKFLGLSPFDRVNEVKRLKLCMICLQPNHMAEKCSWSSGCKHCNKSHNSLLHFNQSNRQHIQSVNDSNQQSSHIQTSQAPQTNPKHYSANIQSTQASSSQPDEISTISTHSYHTTPKIACLLATANVIIFDKNNEPHTARVLLDPGSMTNFITANLVQRLGLQTQQVNLSVMGVSSSIATSAKSTQATIKSLHNSFKVVLDFYVLDKITEQLPISYINIKKFIIPSNIPLADESFNIPGQIDMLLSADIYYDLLGEEKIKISDKLPFLIETKLGWIISGKYDIPKPKNHTRNVNAFCNFSIPNSQQQCNRERLSDQLEKFWKIEETTAKVKYTKEEQECEDLFTETTTHDSNGHFIVNLPLKQGIQELGDNKEIAIKRFYNLERKLQSKSDIKRLYEEFMDTYERLGHMSRIPKHEINQSKHPVYYLPHHPVVKEASATCKLRVVFDASCKTNTGISLNDKLKVGPQIQDDLYAILVRFRKHNYVLGADVAKMYRMVWIEPTQRDLQRIVWRSTPQEELQHFRLNTVTYGTASASFLAIRSLHQAAKDFQQEYPLSSQSIIEDFYVDDYLSGSDTREGCHTLKTEVSKILAKSGFVLRKWICNDRSILDKSEQMNTQIEHYITEDNQTKTLGVLWQVDEDFLKFSVVMKSDIKPTKRNILSIISMIFDPLGLIGPIIVRAKIILQRIWNEKLDWDDTVSPELQSLWNKFYQDLPLIEDLRIPRHALVFQARTIELHGYCDASEQAYGACIYARSTNGTEVITRLLCAKSKVAPLRTITIPRLELSAALLLSRLMTKTVEALHIKIEDIFYWTDSLIVLSWLALEPAQLKTFIGNRVSEIQTLTKVNRWSHVPSQENPADIISRGYGTKHLQESFLWWQGPIWLSKSRKFWPSTVELIDPPEKRTPKVQVLLASIEQNIFTKFSSLIKLQRVFAYCFRFIKNVKSSENKILGSLTAEEIELSFQFLIKQAQSQDFSSEITCLQQNKPISNHSKLISLNPFLDSKGIVRLGGRIGKSHAKYDQKFPIILSGKHPLAELIIKREHIRNLHMGTQAILANIRSQFWLLSGRNAVKKVLRKCIICFRNNPSTINTLMGELPESRVIVSRPFYHAGVDYAGPFYIKASQLRSSKTVKTYLCIFVCMTSKAVHLEIVSSLSTHAFLNALKRFFSRRGKSKHLFSDNGTNFVGANRELQALTDMLKKDADILNNTLSQDGVTWHFIPPRSPHFGGLWESCVKSAKYHLKRVVGESLLTFEELSTIVTQVEACMNSRPICPLSDDPTDLTPLTPGHFLIGGPLVALPQMDLENTPMNRLSRYQHLTKMIQHFWHRWSAEYLPSLNPRSKWWQDNSTPLKEGTMVLLKDDVHPPLKWPLGRIVHLHPGTDNVVRVVSIRTATGITKRAINKISLLPIDS